MSKQISGQNGSAASGSTRVPPDAGQIAAWIASRVARLLRTNPKDIDLHAPLESHGLDSAAVVGLTGELEDWLGIEIDPSLPYDFPTISGLAEQVAAQMQKGAPRPEPATRRAVPTSR